MAFTCIYLITPVLSRWPYLPEHTQLCYLDGHHLHLPANIYVIQIAFTYIYLSTPVLSRQPSPVFTCAHICYLDMHHLYLPEHICVINSGSQVAMKANQLYARFLFDPLKKGSKEDLFDPKLACCQTSGHIGMHFLKNGQVQECDIFAQINTICMTRYDYAYKKCV